MDVKVTWWRRYGENRLFVEQDGERLGWMDLRDGTTVVADNDRRDEVFTALERYIASRKVPQQR